MIYLKFIIAGWFFFTSFSAKADFVAMHQNCNNLAGCYVLSGEITKQDALAVREITEESLGQNLSHPQILLNSKGGDVYAAFSIGRDIRKIQGAAIVTMDSVCYSACVFILAGATQRLVGGSVGIHRPYRNNTELVSIDEAQSQYTMLMKDSKKFLEEMNLSGELYEAMVRISPEQIRILSDNELSAYGLNRIDPVQDDYYDTVGAGSYGITKQEYLARKYKKDTVCERFVQAGDQDAFQECSERVMSGR